MSAGPGEGRLPVLAMTVGTKKPTGLASRSTFFCCLSRAASRGEGENTPMPRFVNRISENWRPFFLPEGESGCVLGIQGDTGRDGEAVTKFWGSGQSGRFGLHGRAGFSPVHRDDLGGSAAVVEFDVSMGGAVFVDAFGDLDVVCAVSGDLEERLVIAG